MFNPWNASFEEAVAAEDLSADAGPGAPIYQFAAVQRINERRVAIDGGDGFAVLACIRDCVTHELIAPAWLAYAFNRRYDAVLNCRADSWDAPASFGKPYPKGTHLIRLRQDREGRRAVWSAVYEFVQMNPDAAIDRYLFEQVGKPLKLGATRAERLYYEAIRKLGLPNIAKTRKLTGIRK